MKSFKISFQYVDLQSFTQFTQSTGHQVLAILSAEWITQTAYSSRPPSACQQKAILSFFFFFGGGGGGGGGLADSGADSACF